MGGGVEMDRCLPDGTLQQLPEQGLKRPSYITASVLEQKQVAPRGIKQKEWVLLKRAGHPSGCLDDFFLHLNASLTDRCVYGR